MFKVIIVEDEPYVANHLAVRVKKLGHSVSAIFADYSKLLVWLSDTSNPTIDIVLLDIHVADGHSFNIFQSGVDLPSIILTTAYPDYALKAFEASCTDYLLKPFSDERLALAINKVTLNKQQTIGGKKQCSRLLVKRGLSTFPISVADIAYFYLDSLLNLVTKDGQKYLYDTTLEELLKQLDSRMFYRVNRQWIVNLEAVQSIKQIEPKKLVINLTPKFEQPIVVSQDKATPFKRWLAS